MPPRGWPTTSSQAPGSWDPDEIDRTIMYTVGTSGQMEALTPVIHVLRDQNRVGNFPLTIFRLTEEEAFHSVRCPLCAWRPDASSRWCCEPSQSPEPSFPGCLTVWNT